MCVDPGPISVPSLGGNKYIVTFTDDYSRFSYVYMLKNKSDVFEKFQEFHAEVTNMLITLEDTVINY